jgi:hypothetical protein
MNKTIEELKTAKTQAEKDIFKIVSELEVNFGVLIEGVNVEHVGAAHAGGTKKYSYSAIIDLRVT